MCVLKQKREWSVLRCNLKRWLLVSGFCYWQSMSFYSDVDVYENHMGECMYCKDTHPQNKPHQYTSNIIFHLAWKHMLNQRKKQKTGCISVWSFCFKDALLLHLSDSAFCWVTLFWMRLRQTVNSPTQSCMIGHKQGRDGGNKREVANHVALEP